MLAHCNSTGGWDKLILIFWFGFCSITMTAQDNSLRGASLISDTLSNGITYFIQSNSKPSKRVELRLAVKSGSMQESENQRGLAHFVEHMAFNGTTHFKKNELITYLESTGMRFGPDLNAYTSFDETVYLLQIKTNTASALDSGMLILTDWASGISLDHEEVDKERGVILSEWRTRLNVNQRQRDAVRNLLYPGSRYVNRLPIGDTAIIRNAPVSALTDYYATWYRPDRMAVVAVGDIDPQEAESLIKTYFGSISSDSGPLPEMDRSIAMPTGFSFEVLTDPEAAFTEIEWYLPLFSDSLAKKTKRSEYLHTLFNRMMGARLYEIQQTNPTFTFGTSARNRGLGKKFYYLISALTASDQLQAGFQTVLEETFRVSQDGFLPGELDRKKKELLERLALDATEANQRTSSRLAAEYVNHFLNQVPLQSPTDRLIEATAIMDSISLDDVNKLLPGWLAGKESILIIKAPAAHSDHLPDKDEVWNWITQSANKAYEPYREKINEGALFSTTLRAKKAQKIRAHPQLDVHEYRLPNAVRLIVKPTALQNDEILMSAFSPGGHSVYSNDLYQQAASASSLIDQSGLADFSATELAKKLAGRSISISPFIGEWHEGFSGRTTKADVELLLQLIHLYVTQPRQDGQVLQTYLAQQRGVLENLTKNPYYQFGETSFAVRYGNHPRRGIPKLQALEKLSMDTMYAIFRERLGDLTDFTFVFVGNIDLATFPDLVATYIGGLPASGHSENWKDTGTRLVPGKIDTVLTGGSAPKAIVEINWHNDFVYDSESRLAYQAMLSILRVRLRERMREELGGVYGTSVRGTILPFPTPNFRTSIRFDCDQGMLDTLLSTIYDEIFTLQESEIANQYLLNFQAAQWQAFQEGQEKNSFWLGQITTRFRQQIPLRGLHPAVFAHYLYSLTAKDIQAAARDYFPSDNVIQLVLLPAGASVEGY